MNVFGIILGPTDLWLLAAAGGCLAWLIPHRLAISRDSRGSFRAASIKFRSAVLTTLAGLYPVQSNWPSNELKIIDVLEERFPALQAAVAEFRQQLPLGKRWLFDRAWKVYRLGKDGREIDGQYYWQYVPHTGEGIENGKRYKHDNRLSYKSAFKRNVDRLLGYASQP
ncbi:MAG: hypothetical protein ACREVY_06700 [Gammaproteobacteria bacterium]